MPVITWPKIIPIHTDNLTPMQIIFLVLFISIIVGIILICRLRCSRFRQQRRLNKNDEIINVPLLNDSEAEQSELRITFQESDDDYSEYIGKLNLLVSPKVHEELQQLIQPALKQLKIVLSTNMSLYKPIESNYSRLTLVVAISLGSFHD